MRVGDVQGNPSGPNLGDSAGALRSYQRALELHRGGPAVVPTDPETARTVALAHRRLADVLRGPASARRRSRERPAPRRIPRPGCRPGAPLADRLDAAVAALKQGDLLGNPNLPNLRRPEDAAARFQEALAALQALEARRRATAACSASWGSRGSGSARCTRPRGAGRRRTPRTGSRSRSARPSPSASPGS